MLLRTLLLLTGVGVALQGCGDGKGSTAATSLSFSDSDAMSEVGTAQTEEVVASVAMDSGVALSFDASGGNTFTTSRECVAKDDGSVEVKIASSGSKETSKTVGNVAITQTMSGESALKRAWSRASHTLNCNSAKTAAVINLKSDLAGLKLVQEFSRARSHSQRVENLKKGSTKTKSRSFSSSGKREVSFVSSSISDTAVQHSIEVKLQTERTSKIQNKSGVTHEFSYSMKTADSAPLKVTVVRNPTTLKAESSTVSSGTLIATHKDGSRIETSFTNLKVLGADKMCAIESGSISAKVYANDATEASANFDVQFENGDASMSLANGELKEVIAPLCDPEDE